MYSVYSVFLFNLKVDDTSVLVEEDSINCPICIRTFKQPKILPCGHSFCEVCLERQMQMSIRTRREQLTCSKCKQETKIPDGGLKDLPLNKTLAQQVDEARYIHKRKQVIICLFSKNESINANANITSYYLPA